MFSLKIRFESSWTNSFFDAPGGEPLFTSGSALTKSTKGLVAVDTALLRDHPTRQPFLRALQASNPDLLYRVPENFDRTVQGVLSRLVGEVRRLSDVEADHLALRAFSAGRYVLDVEHEHSQTTKLTTYNTNDIQTGGAGLISNESLYGPTSQAKYLFGFLSLSLDEMQKRATEILSWSCVDEHPEFQWTPASPAALMDRLNVLLEEQTEVVKVAKSASKNDTYETPYLALCQELASALPDETQFTLNKNVAAGIASGKPAAATIEEGGLEGWALAGALMVARIKGLAESERAEFIASGALTKNGGLSGMGMSGTVGRITEKDMFAFSTGAKAQSNRMPYGITVPVSVNVKGKNMNLYLPTGVLKKTGSLVFEIDSDEDVEQELFDAIEAASVGPFHFGKKGVAYIQQLTLY